MPTPLDPHAIPPTSSTSHDQQHRSATGVPRPFETLDQSFRLLVCEPAPLALDEAIDRYNLGKLLASMGEHEAALDQLERSVAIATDHLGSDHPWTTTFQTTLDQYRRPDGSQDEGDP